jgi:hypothetical protein
MFRFDDKCPTPYENYIVASIFVLGLDLLYDKTPKYAAKSPLKWAF